MSSRKKINWNFPSYYDCSADINAFYKDFPTELPMNKIEEGFNDISDERIEELKKLVHKVNSRRISVDSSIFHGARKHSNLMNHLRTNKHLYGLESSSEMYMLFVLCADPNLEALLMYLEANKLNDARYKLEAKFGVADFKLVKLERIYLKKFISKEEKEKFDEEKDRRIWK